MTIRLDKLTYAPLHVGTWRGPGILALIGDEWRYLDPATLSRADVRRLREQARATVGVDGPVISITRAGERPETVAP